MSTKQKIVVFTATGDQGSSVAKYLNKDGSYEVWGITRNTESDSAKALAGEGIKMVKGDLEDVSSYAPHLEGAYGAYVNADFWVKYWSNGMNGEEAGKWEYGLSSKAIEACAKAGVKHIVYSTLDGVPYTPHMLYKQKVTEWAKSKNYPVTNLYTGHYISNLTKFQALKPEGDGFTLNLPISDDTPIINFAVEQTGAWVLAAFKDPKKYIGARVDACSEILTAVEWAKELTQLLGKPVKTLGLPAAIYQDMSGLTSNGVPEELILNYKGFYENLCPRDVAASKAIVPDQWDTKTWAENTGSIKKYLASLEKA